MGRDRYSHDHLCRTNFLAFFQAAFPILCPGDVYRPEPYLEALCFALEQVARGKRQRQLISLPPRHSKSIAAVALTAWLMGRKPSSKVISVSYGGELAEAQSILFRRLIASPLFRRLFPSFVVARNRADLVETTMGGSRRSTTPNGATTGFGADYIIVDDLLKAGDTYSETLREAANNFFDQTLFSRFNNKQKGAIIGIGQRLHERDIVGHLRTKCDWHELILPAIAEERESFEGYYGQQFTRRPGDVLSSIEPQEVLDDIRRMIGNWAFSAQYLQNPLPPDGARVKWNWFPVYDYPAPREAFSRVVQSWDTATSDEPHSAFSVCLTFGWHEGKWCLLDIYRRKVNFPDLKRAALRLEQDWRPDKILIEDASSGRQLIQELSEKLGVGRSLLTVMPPDRSKEERLDLASAKIEDGLIAVPEEAPWLKEFERELLGFPNAQYKDQVDALTQFVRWTSFRQGRELVRPNGRARAAPRQRSDRSRNALRA